jgi:hypothetical protein
VLGVGEGIADVDPMAYIARVMMGWGRRTMIHTSSHSLLVRALFFILKF